MSVDLRLTREERRKAFDGSLHTIRRKIKPYPLAQGQEVVVSSTRGGRQVVDYETGATVDIPSVPNLWATVKGWTLKDGEWEIVLAVVDQRDPVRRLSMGVPNGTPQPGGLKTRQGKPKPKGAEIESWTPETERGYGGSGGVEAVDDAALERFAFDALHGNEALRDSCRDEDAARAAEEDVATETLHGNIPGARAAQRRAERARRRVADRDLVAA